MSDGCLSLKILYPGLCNPPTKTPISLHVIILILISVLFQEPINRPVITELTDFFGTGSGYFLGSIFLSVNRHVGSVNNRTDRIPRPTVHSLKKHWELQFRKHWVHECINYFPFRYS